MKGTKIVITALTLKGREALAIHKADEIDLRAKYKNHPSCAIPFRVRNYLKTVSLFMPKDGSPVRHEILGFKHMDVVARMNFYNDVKVSFKDNGCSISDFEVRFYDIE